MSLQSVNPSTGELIRRYDETDAASVDRMLAAAVRAQAAWAERSFADRASVMRKAASVLRARAGTFAELMAREMGKPLPQGRAEIEKCAVTCDYFAEHAARFLADEAVPTEAQASYVSFRPIGVVLAIMPWNFPFFQVFRCLAPTLMAGNAVLLKHASNVQGCALAIADVARDAGLPQGLFDVLRIGSARVNDIVRRNEIHAVTLTGSTPAGRAVAAAAGDALKKSVLELGGSDPYLVLEDADLAEAAGVCVSSRLINGGQSCIAAKRFIAVAPVLEEFTERVVASMRAKRFGDPIADPTVDLGPLARRDLRDELHDQVVRSVRAGAKLLLGGETPKGPGAFYPPTVLAGVRRGIPAYAEETFGPVASIVPAESEAHAIEIANDTAFGLGAAVFTRDVARGERIAREKLDAGVCFVNDFVRSDPRLPFGGIKTSGFGRELAAFGIREFVNVKTVWVRGR